MADDQNKSIRRVAVARSSEEMPIPPPPGFRSPFQTIDGWLTAICAGAPPQRPIAEFSFLLFGVTDNYLICLLGHNTYLEKDCEIRRIDFKPSVMFFALPESFYVTLTMKQVREKVLKELVAFTQTATFKDSYLAKGGCITTSFSDEIWPVNDNQEWCQ